MTPKEISPGRKRAFHQLAVQAMARVQGQGILFKGPVKYNFPRALDESELGTLRSYIAERTKLTLEYDFSTRGVMQPTYSGSLEDRSEFSDQTSIASYTMNAWDSKMDPGKVGIYFSPVNDESRIQKTKFRGIEFTPDSTGKMSPERDEELRHRLLRTFEGYFNKDNIDAGTFETIGRDQTGSSQVSA